MFINRITPKVSALVGEGFTHYAYGYYNSKRGETVYGPDNQIIERGELFVEPDGEHAERTLEDLTKFAETVGGKVCNYAPREFVKVLADAGFNEEHNPVGATWSKRHVWIGFSM